MLSLTGSLIKEGGVPRAVWTDVSGALGGKSPLCALRGVPEGSASRGHHPVTRSLEMPKGQCPGGISSREGMLFQESGDFVGCTHSNSSTLSVREQSQFCTLGYQCASPAPATTRGKYAATCHILPMTCSATLTSSVLFCLRHVCPHGKGTHGKPSQGACLTVFSVLHCSSRKQTGYHLPFGWIRQRWRKQFCLCA